MSSMLEPTYRQAITHAWQLVWRNKILWIFGLFAAFAGQLGLNNFIGQLVFLVSHNVSVRDYLAIFYVNFQRGGTVWLVWLIFLGLIVCVAIAFLAVASQGALIAAAADWFKKKKTPDFTRGWQKGIKHFWKLLFLNILKRVLLALTLLAMIFSWSRFVFGTENLAALSLILSLGTLAALVISVSEVYASGYIVEEEYGFGKALYRGWQLFSNHLFVSVELSVLLVFLDALVITAIFTASTLVLIPLVIFVLLAGLTGLTWLVGIGVIISLSLLTVLLAVVGAIYNSFTISAWIYLFMKMHREGVASRLMHWLKKSL